MFFESHFRLEGNYGKPFAAFPKPGANSFLIWYADDRNNVYCVETWLANSKEGVQEPKAILAIEQSRGTSRRVP